MSTDADGLHSRVRVIWAAGTAGSRKKRADHLFEIALEFEQILRGRVSLTAVGLVPEERVIAERLGVRVLEPLPRREFLRELRKHDVLLSTSVYEQFGYQALEAMIRGVVPLMRHSLAAVDLFGEMQDDLTFSSAREAATMVAFMTGSPGTFNRLRRAIVLRGRQFLYRGEDLSLMLGGTVVEGFEGQTSG